MGGRGYADGLNSGMVIGLPPVMNFGKEPLRSRVVEEVLSGQKVSSVCNCIHLMRMEEVLYTKSIVASFAR